MKCARSYIAALSVLWLLAGCSKTPVACADLPLEATTKLVVDHLKSGWAPNSKTEALDVAAANSLKMPDDFSTLVAVAAPVVETVSQAPDGNSANCAAHYEAVAHPDIHKIAVSWKGRDADARAAIQAAHTTSWGDELGPDGYFQHASRQLAGTSKVLKQYIEVNPGPSILPPEKFTGTLRYVLTRAEGQDRKYAVMAEPIAPKWAQALIIYKPLDKWMAERTGAAERKQLWGAFSTVTLKSHEMCGEEALCLKTKDDKEFVVNASAMKREALETLVKAAESGGEVCLTHLEKNDGKLFAGGVETECR